MSINDDLRFIEIQAIHDLFELFELSTVRIGSGRPPGRGFEIWGILVAATRSALERALYRLHESQCHRTKCGVSKYGYPKWDPPQFFAFFDSHGWNTPENIPDSLHLQLRRKTSAKATPGVGKAVNGPLTKSDLSKHLDGFNHIRNGFSHGSKTKHSKLPPGGQDIIWTARDEHPTNPAWTVQKPHAFSVIRLAHTIHRYAVLSVTNERSARSNSTPPPHYITDRVASEEIDHTRALLSSTAQAIDEHDLGQALRHARNIPLAIMRDHHTNPAESFSLDFGTSLEPISDPVLPTPSPPSTTEATNQQSLPLL